MLTNGFTKTVELVTLPTLLAHYTFAVVNTHTGVGIAVLNSQAICIRTEIGYALTRVTVAHIAFFTGYICA
jgi:hypothetical protein